ncbi:hypothetical protein GF377_05680 [candidate division GN15 bacterium]|nr:hypothetical protein [candidate division GN15 bacterium]
MLAFGPEATADVLSVKAGLGYEFLSQEFFVDSLDEAGADSLAIITSNKTTYLDDLKAQFSLRWRPRDDRKLEFRADYDQTPDVIRLRLANYFRPTWGKVKVDWQGELDVRHGYGDEADATDSYLYGQGRAKFMLPIATRSTLFWRLRGDFVQFDSVAAPSFNHWRLGGETGYLLYFGDFSSWSTSGFLLGRSVPDSTPANYLSYGLESSMLAFYGPGNELDIYARLEVKDYNQPLEEDDYVRLEGNIRHKMRLGRLFFFRQDFESEALIFDKSDAYTSNYARYRLNLLLGIELTQMTAALGPHLELQDEDTIDDEFAIGESYLESGIQAELDYIDADWVFASVESVFGYRNLREETDFLTSFTFERLSLLADIRFWDRVSLTALVSAEWEWHDDPEENSRLILLSTGVYYTF